MNSLMKYLKNNLTEFLTKSSDEPTGRGLYQSLLEAEAVITGQKLGLLNKRKEQRLHKL